MTDDIACLKRLDAAAAAIREYAGSAQSKLQVTLLNDLEATYLQDLRTCKAEALPGLQAALKQCGELRRVLQGEHSNGRI